MKNTLLLIPALLFTSCGNGLFNSCNDKQVLKQQVRILDFKTGVLESFDFDIEDFFDPNFTNTTELKNLPNNKVLSRSSHRSFIIDLDRLEVVEIEHSTSNNYAIHDESQNFFTVEDKFGTITLNDSVNIKIKEQTSLLSRNIFGEEFSQVFSIKTKKVEDSKVIVPNILFAVESFIDNKEGIIILLDLDTRIITTDSLNSITYNNRFFYERKLMLLNNTGEAIEELARQENPELTYNRITFISSASDLIASQQGDNIIILDAENGEEWIFEDYSTSVISDNGKYMASINSSNTFSIIDIKSGEEMIHLNNSHYYSYLGSSFSPDSETLFFRDVGQDVARIKMARIEEPSLGITKVLFDLFEEIPKVEGYYNSIGLSMPLAINEDQVLFISFKSVNKLCD